MDRRLRRKLKLPKKVVCTVCKKSYSYGVCGQVQAADCAAGYCEQGSRKFICGFYGSQYDTTLYEFRGDVPANWYKANPVCDSCVAAAIADGLLVLIPGDYPWGLFRFPDNLNMEPVPVEIPPMPPRTQN